MKRFLGLVAALVLLGLGCGRSEPMLGKWVLYVPADAKAEAERKGEAVPSGTAEFKADGTCEFLIDAMGKRTTFRGTYRRDGLTLIVDGEENGVKRADNGVLSDDFKTFRINGKDFEK